MIAVFDVVIIALLYVDTKKKQVVIYTVYDNGGDFSYVDKHISHLR